MCLTYIKLLAYYYSLQFEIIKINLTFATKLYTYLLSEKLMKLQKYHTHGQYNNHSFITHVHSSACNISVYPSLQLLAQTDIHDLTFTIYMQWRNPH